MVRYRLFTGFRCNNACRFCDQADARLRHTDTSDLVELVESTLVDEVEAITFCGGECTLESTELGDAARRARELGCDEVRVFTNGRMLAYRRIARQLVSNGVTHFDISLHGSNAVTHEWSTRVPSSFEQTISGARNVTMLGAQVSLNFVLLRSNYRQLKDFIQLAISLGASALHLRFPIPEGAITQERILPYLVPRFRMILPHLQGAARLSAQCGLGTWLHDIPDCQTGSLRSRITRDSSPWIGLPDDVWQRSEKRFGEMCEQCGVREICTGIPAEYLDYYGDGELQAF